jgi:hypothetical protein
MADKPYAPERILTGAMIRENLAKQAEAEKAKTSATESKSASAEKKG